MIIIITSYISLVLFLIYGNFMHKDRILLFIWRIISIALLIISFNISVRTIHYTFDYLSELPLYLVFSCGIYLILFLTTRNLISDLNKSENNSIQDRVFKKLYLFLLGYFLVNLTLFVYLNISPVKYLGEDLTNEWEEELKIDDFGFFHHRTTHRLGFIASEEFGYSFENESSFIFVSIFPYPSFYKGNKKSARTCHCDHKSDKNFNHKFDLFFGQYSCVAVKEKITEDD